LVCNEREDFLFGFILEDNERFVDENDLSDEDLVTIGGVEFEIVEEDDGQSFPIFEHVSAKRANGL
jgi:hypothetical protein